MGKLQEACQKGTFRMNRIPQGLVVPQAISGSLGFKMAEGLSPRTLTGYEPRQLQSMHERGSSP